LKAATKPTPLFDEEALVALGVPDQEVVWFHELHDSFELQQLELIDQATREGWRETPRFYGEFQDQLSSLRDELGEELYDLMLYAAGEKNRVIVGDILNASPAEESGIESGDVIVSYDGRRVFNTHELQGATTEGERGEPVAIEILRNGQPKRIFVPRGPLGVRMHAERQPP
jgi:hypothetical protein